MKIIVAHMSPDLDAITSTWVIKKFVRGWEDAAVKFVPAGTRLERVKNHPDFLTSAVVSDKADDILHVDTGLGPLDHHQTADRTVSAASRAWEYAQEQAKEKNQVITPEVAAAVDKIVAIVVNYDHFLDVFRPEAGADYQEFSLFGILEGLLYSKPGEDEYAMEFGMACLNYLLHYFQNKAWAEKEIAAGMPFATKFGRAIGIETLNDSVVKVAQKQGYTLVVRKDPKRGNVAIKAVPDNPQEPTKKGIDLTLAYEQLSKTDPNATWFLHVSKKMLLNGSTKNPNMIPTTLTLEQIVGVLKSLYA